MHSARFLPNANESEQIFLEILLCDRSHALDFDMDSLLRLRYFCIEFAACYRSKRIQDAVSPNDILVYLRGAQRRLRELDMQVNLFTVPVFADPEQGLVAVLVNKFSEQQGQGRTMKSLNFLCSSDV